LFCLNPNYENFLPFKILLNALNEKCSEVLSSGGVVLICALLKFSLRKALAPCVRSSGMEELVAGHRH